MTSTTVLSSTSGSHGAGIYASGPVTVTGGLFRNNRCTQPSCGATALLAAGPLTVSGTQFISNTSQGSAGAVYAPSAAAITGALFQDNHCVESGCFGGALYANNSLSLTNTQFLSNSSTYYGGALYAALTATVRGGLFRNNRCTDAGCGGGAAQATALVLTNTQFISNSSLAGGGAAVTFNTIVALDSLVQDNRCTAADCKGGGLLAGFSLRLTNTQVLSNTATANGGGAYTDGPAVLTGGLVQNNRCTQTNCSGGGLFTSAALTLTNAQFVSNTSGFDGGGAFATGAATLTGGLFQGNQCTQTFCYAGGLMASGPAGVTGTRFISNSSQSHGGGLFANGLLVISGAEFRGNQSGMGGGLNLAGPSGQIVNTLFAGNQASSGHGLGLSLLTAGPVSLTHNTLVSGAAGPGSAVYVLLATVRLTDTLVAGFGVGLERATGSLAEDYTLFDGVAQPYSGTVSAGAHTFAGTAAFLNLAAGDFHLTAASAARDAGLTTSVVLDFDGQPRPAGLTSDIGFDEFYAKLYLPQVLR